MMLRKSRSKDFDEIYKIIKEEYARAPYREKWTYENGIKTLKYYSKWGEIYVAEIENKIVGFIVMHKEHYNDGEQIHVKELAVKKAFQGRGIGKALIKKAEDYCKTKRIKHIYLTTSKDAPAFHFYMNLGYIPDKKAVFFKKEVII